MKDECCGENEAGEGTGEVEDFTVLNKVVREGLSKEVAVIKD